MSISLSVPSSYPSVESVLLQANTPAGPAGSEYWVIIQADLNKMLTNGLDISLQVKDSSAQVVGSFGLKQFTAAGFQLSAATVRLLLKPQWTVTGTGALGITIVRTDSLSFALSLF